MEGEEDGMRDVRGYRGTEEDDKDREGRKGEDRCEERSEEGWLRLLSVNRHLEAFPRNARA